MKQEPHWPQLFHEIIRNDKARAVIRSRVLTGGGGQEDFREGRRLMKEREDYRKAARALLRWDPKSGNKGRREA